MPRKKEQKNFSYRPIVGQLSRFNLIDKELSNSHQTIPSVTDINTINKIEKYHGFTEGALIEYFYDLDRFVSEIKSTEKQIPRDSDKKALLEEMATLVDNLLCIIKNDYAGSQIKNELYELTKFYIYPENYNYLHHVQYALKFLSDHLICKVSQDKLGIYSKTLNFHIDKLIDCLKRGGLWIHNDISGINDYPSNEDFRLIDFIENSLNDLLTRINKASLTYTKKTGKPFNAVKHNLLIKLLWIYEDGTKKPAHIYWNEHGEGFTGEFADFLYDCAQLLIKYFLSPDDTYDSLARMARETLPYYKELPYSIK